MTYLKNHVELELDIVQLICVRIWKWSPLTDGVFVGHIPMKEVAGIGIVRKRVDNFCSLFAVLCIKIIYTTNERILNLKNKSEKTAFYKPGDVELMKGIGFSSCWLAIFNNVHFHGKLKRIWRLKRPTLNPSLIAPSYPSVPQSTNGKNQ